MLSFGEAIAYELKGTGVTITTLCPGATATEFSQSGRRRRSPAVPQHVQPRHERRPRCRHRLSRVKKGRRVVVSGLLNKLFAASGRFAPRFMTLPIAKSLMSLE